ncbi:hypothetical protein IMZ68_05745 [Candidatus Bathyarchaeota archaeon]|nr:hypothetical protein [Candidatus Bathyarchaeota archaeon]
MTEAAKNFLVKYQAFSGVDSSELIRVLGNFDEAKGSTVTLGNIRFSVSHFVIPNVANATTFKWIYAMNSTDSVSVALG